MSRIREASTLKLTGNLVDPPNAAAVKKGVGFAHGTFGELLQGALRGENNHFLVTLPITRFTKVVFTLDEALDAISSDLSPDTENPPEVVAGGQQAHPPSRAAWR
jgi:hypothetical protein